MVTLKIETEMVETPGALTWDLNGGGGYIRLPNGVGPVYRLRIGSKTYDRIALVYEGQRRVWIRQDGTMHTRRSQPRRGQRHVYTRAMQYIFFSPKVGQFVTAITGGRMFIGRLRRGNVYGMQAAGPTEIYTTELTRIRRRPWSVPTLNAGDLGRIRRQRDGLDGILHLEREYQEVVKAHPLLSKRYSQMEPINA